MKLLSEARNITPYDTYFKGWNVVGVKTYSAPQNAIHQGLTTNVRLLVEVAVHLEANLVVTDEVELDAELSVERRHVGRRLGNHLPAAEHRRRRVVVDTDEVVQATRVLQHARWKQQQPVDD